MRARGRLDSHRQNGLFRGLRFAPFRGRVSSLQPPVTRAVRRDKDGNQQEDTEWFNVEAWGRLGEVCQEYLKKGSLIFLEGRLKTDKYEKDGEKRYFTKVVASQMQMLDKKE